MDSNTELVQRNTLFGANQSKTQKLYSKTNFRN
jgi:hypothetical protein